MATLISEVNSVLGIEIGQIHTRAILFDVVEESYHLIATGVTDSTFMDPVFDIGEGVFEAIAKLQDVTGRILLDREGNLIIPSQSGIEGVDRLVITVSCGEDLRLATFGLLNDVSLESANQVARASFTEVIDRFGINDRRSVQAQMDALLAARPEILIVAGGTDRGATRSVARMTQMIETILQIIPKGERPKVLYCGNRAMAKRVKQTLEKVTDVRVSNNVRPSIDTEDLEKAVQDLGKLVLDNRMEKIGGLSRIAPLCSDQPILSSTGLQRIVQFLGKQYDPDKGVLGVDLGSAHTMTAYSNGTKNSINVIPFGMGKGLENFLHKTSIEAIQRWMPEAITNEELASYLWQKTLYPATIPGDETSLAIELAVARLILQSTMKEITGRSTFHSRCFEPIIVSGSVLTRTATPQHVLLTLLDGIQPHGITPIILDKHGIIPLLGASAKINPLLPVQVLESTAFINLVTVITTESMAKNGSVLMNARLEYISGETVDAEIIQGSIVSLPLKSGEIGYLHLKNVRRAQIDDVEINNNPIRIKGGVCGVVIDSRGRPLALPAEDERRRELFKRWSNLLGNK